MRRMLIMILAGVAITAAAHVGGRQYQRASRLWDARLAGELRTLGTDGTPNVMFDVILPSGRWQEFTAVAWLRLVPTNSAWLTTSAFWCGDPLQMENPDLTVGEFGYGTVGGTNLTTVGGSITIDPFDWQPYSLAGLSNEWPRGVYTIAGWASNECTISLGGTNVVLGPGDFTQNVIPGADSSVSVTGTGLVSIGISRTPGGEFFQAIDGVRTNDYYFTTDSCVSTNISICVWRFRCTASNQIYKSNLGLVDDFDLLSQVTTNTLPQCGMYDSRGVYRVGLNGVGQGSGTPVEHDIWDGRVFNWWLSDDELQRIHTNAVQEIIRRGIPVSR